MPPTDEKTIPWKDADKPIPGLATDIEHHLQIQHEAIPLVFVPGIMGTCLRLQGTDGTGFTNSLPNMRWNPSSMSWMLKYMSGASGAKRKEMLVGVRFFPNYLEPNNSSPVGDGFIALMDDYAKKFLTPLKTHDWGALSKIFEFPVFAVGYNWTDSAESGGEKLAQRIKDIIAEAQKTIGLCEKVILITHSMGGLVGRSASELSKAHGSILGIVHGVQPVTGTPAAYWRMKAGFEGFGMTSRILGNSALSVTPVLGNIPGGLQLLPNKLHRTNSGSHAWLTVTDGAATTLALPHSDPYAEIYRVKAVVVPPAGVNPSNNAYWGLVDPHIVDPDFQPPALPPNARDQIAMAKQAPDPWSNFLAQLKVAEAFHDKLANRQHDNTFCARGVGHKTADRIELRVESNWVRSDPYPKRGFRGFFTTADGKDKQAVLQDPAGDGDGTVARSSAAALDKPGKQLPGDRAFDVEHQPAFEDSAVKDFTYQAIIALCKKHYEAKRHKLGDYPAPSPGHA